MGLWAIGWESTLGRDGLLLLPTYVPDLPFMARHQLHCEVKLYLSARVAIALRGSLDLLCFLDLLVMH